MSNQNLFELVPHDWIEFDYVNWKGLKSRRRMEVGELHYGSNEFHPEPQWLLDGYDLDKKAPRMFAMKDMSNVKRVEQR